MKPAVIFRVDGGNVYSVAMGHVYRCVRLARVLREKGTDCLFFMRHYPDGVSLVESAGFEVEIFREGIPDEEEATLILSRALSMHAIFFIDLRTSKKAIIDLANAHHMPTIVYEDVSSEALEPTLLINPSPGCNNLYNSDNTKYLLGSNYLILDPAIAGYRRDVFSSTINRLFVCFGGADPCNLSSRVMAILLERENNFTIDMIIGPAFAQAEKLEGIIRNHAGSKAVNLIRGCNQLAPIMSRADAAITSGGTIVYETVAMHLPTLALPSIEHEARIVSFLMDKGIVMGIKKDTAEADEGALNAIISRFLDDIGKRDHCYQAQELLDISNGITAVANNILSLFSEQSHHLNH